MRSQMLALGLSLAAAMTANAESAIVAWPPWLSIETPVNPFDPTTRGAVMLVHSMLRDGVAKVSDVTGIAEGVVGGRRRSIPLRLEPTARPGVFAVRRQWPAEGTWLVRFTLDHTTAIVTLNAEGDVASIRVPTETAQGHRLPRAVGEKEIDSTLATSVPR